MTSLAGFPSIDDAVSLLKKNDIEQVILKPFMVVAGNHALGDMIGNKPESLKNRLEDAGFTVRPVISGLGEQDEFARIFAARDRNLAAPTAPAAGLYFLQADYDVQFKLPISGKKPVLF